MAQSSARPKALMKVVSWAEMKVLKKVEMTVQSSAHPMAVKMVPN